MPQTTRLESGTSGALRSYSDLQIDVYATFDLMEVSSKQLLASLALFEWLYEQHAPTAQGSAEALLLVCTTAQTIRQYLPTLPLDLPAIAISGLLHDIGKPKVGISLLEKSENGQEWTPQDTLRMNPHVEHSFHLLGAAGFGDNIRYPVAQHHDPQIYGSYSPQLSLNTRQRVTRDCTAAGDSVSAMFTRHNQRNGHLNWCERRAAILPNLQLFFDNPIYGSAGQELAGEVLDRCETAILPIARTRLPANILPVKIA